MNRKGYASVDFGHSRNGKIQWGKREVQAAQKLCELSLAQYFVSPRSAGDTTGVAVLVKPGYSYPTTGMKERKMGTKAAKARTVFKPEKWKIEVFNVNMLSRTS